MNDSLETFVPLVLRRRGVQRVADDDRDVHDVTLIDGLARALYWQHLLDTGAMKSGSAIARAEKLHPSVVNELLRLTLLAPDIIERMMAGKQPRRLTLMWFQRNRLTVDWQAQRELMASFEGEG
ncbi:site-specific recombinase resolvase [Laribacter hongkongensis]|uniref:Site-specific recombinase resolvase n=1 Tax=Laribacter hongkongensis TaxID=168471 RepID=A0A248LGE8_9NEIS|nr:site-specific recombinase resolvase [Laribacter hongkongensis]ASJ23858.1 site-specific recombinase resolvase [Laribacter hongkongensis]MCG9025410.1 site-specific recombinase resolvase [Laribacter hongkongensis]MCG9058735.1 site-specific recombinase resolvase [Laribacter hongkongensis]MCG9100373.1 site-specific recombinase resolvase [Laribacter hongkongensis]MCG9105022.1 site-specific recombinase resolvase [Laribacter hongkongensis]